MARRVFPQSAVIPFRRASERIDVLLITNLRGTRWVLPKGLVEPDLTPHESAAKEAFEEAGAQGEVRSTCVGIYDYEKWGGLCRVEVYLFEVHEMLDTFPEQGSRRLRWCSPGEAAQLVRERRLKEILRDVPRLLDP